MRPDLINDGLSVPLGDTFYGGTDRFKYRWVDDDNFEVFYMGEWVEACSIDFEFENIVFGEALADKADFVIEVKRDGTIERL